MDVRALGGGEEGRCVGVVGDEPVCEDGDDGGEEAFDNEDPAPAIQACDAGHLPNALRRADQYVARCSLHWDDEHIHMLGFPQTRLPDWPR